MQKKKKEIGRRLFFFVVEGLCVFRRCSPSIWISFAAPIFVVYNDSLLKYSDFLALDFSLLFPIGRLAQRGRDRTSGRRTRCCRVHGRTRLPFCWTCGVTRNQTHVFSDCRLRNRKRFFNFFFVWRLLIFRGVDDAPNMAAKKNCGRKEWRRRAQRRHLPIWVWKAPSATNRLGHEPPSLSIL